MGVETMRQARGAGFDAISDVDLSGDKVEKLPSSTRALRERNMADGGPPRGGFAYIVPELMVSDIIRSMDFWCRCLGFGVAYQRAESGFAYLQRPDGAQVMLCQRDGTWETGDLEPPYGRGINLHILVEDVDPLVRTLETEGTPFYLAPREVWRRYGDREGGRLEFLIQDPDGYLLLFAKALGERPL